MKNSLRLKLLYSFMLVIIVVLVGVSLGVSFIIKGEMLANKEQELTSKGSELAQAVVTFREQRGSLKQLPEFLNNVEGFIESRVWIVDESRQIVTMSAPQKGMGRAMRGPGKQGMGPGMMLGNAHEGPLHVIFDELDTVFTGKVWTKVFEHPFYGEKMLVVAVPMVSAAGSVEGAVILNAPITELNVFMEHIYYYIGVAGFIAFLLALVVVNWLTHGIVRPLRAMQETAGAMARGDYSNLVKIESRDEVGNLGLALNSLAQDLAKYIDELNHMETLRRDFVANVSHEFRTPMTIIRGYNEALMDGTVSDPALAQKYHRLMGAETARLERLVNDLLDLSRLQSLAVHIDKEKLPLVAIVDSVVNLMKQQIEQKQVMIIHQSAQSVPDIWGNGDRITQLLLIIIDNALKYTAAGGTITISTVVEEDRVAVQVADTGIGIPAEDLPYIWERLYKVDKAHSRANGGTGLGLALAKEIIDIHHAKATVTSQLTRGTTVRIAFPIPDRKEV